MEQVPSLVERYKVQADFQTLDLVFPKLFLVKVQNVIIIFYMYIEYKMHGQHSEDCVTHISAFNHQFLLNSNKVLSIDIDITHKVHNM